MFSIYLCCTIFVPFVQLNILFSQKLTFESNDNSRMSQDEGTQSEDDSMSGGSSDSDEVAARAYDLLEEESQDYFESSYHQKRQIMGLSETKGNVSSCCKKENDWMLNTIM